MFADHNLPVWWLLLRCCCCFYCCRWSCLSAVSSLKGSVLCWYVARVCVCVHKSMCGGWYNSSVGRVDVYVWQQGDTIRHTPGPVSFRLGRDHVGGCCGVAWCALSVGVYTRNSRRMLLCSQSKDFAATMFVVVVDNLMRYQSTRCGCCWRS